MSRRVCARIRSTDRGIQVILRMSGCSMFRSITHRKDSADRHPCRNGDKEVKVDLAIWQH